MVKQLCAGSRAVANEWLRLRESGTFVKASYLDN